MSVFTLDPNVEQFLIADQGEFIVDEVRKHWAAVFGPILELLAIIPVLLLMQLPAVRRLLGAAARRVVPARERALAHARHAHGPLRRHQHARVPRARHPLAARRDHADLAHPRHLGAHADHRPHLQLRALRVRVGRAGAGAPRDPLRRSPTQARAHDPARHPGLGPPRQRRDAPTVDRGGDEPAFHAAGAAGPARRSRGSPPRRPRSTCPGGVRTCERRPRTGSSEPAREPRHPLACADFTTRPSAGILDRPPVVCRTRSGAIGELPKRPKGSDCKSAVYDFGGSNPSLATCGSPGDPGLSSFPGSDAAASARSRRVAAGRGGVAVGAPVVGCRAGAPPARTSLRWEGDRARGIRCPPVRQRAARRRARHRPACRGVRARGAAGRRERRRHEVDPDRRGHRGRPRHRGADPLAHPRRRAPTTGSSARRTRRASARAGSTGSSTRSTAP